MSQQINLINPALRPKADWLGFNVVAPVALACLLVVVVAAVWQRVEQRSLAAREAAVGVQLKAAQERLQALAKALGERTGDSSLVGEAQKLSAAVQRREEALKVLEATGPARRTSFSGAMAGLARQSMEGLWLTTFAAGGEDLEIRGRMLEPSLLPTYIRRLNGEPLFQGRRFDALDIQDVVPKPAAPAVPAGAAAPTPAAREVRLPRYTEFVLRAGGATDKAPAGGAQ